MISSRVSPEVEGSFAQYDVTVSNLENYIAIAIVNEDEKTKQ